ncbi:MAG: response regulator [Candidatus Moranbacteria bacterium]|nr:response regulator [Candidatus Moranbacteria bacterium]
MKKILIVEDDPMLSEIYQKKFENSGRYEVIKATTGTETMEKIKKEKPDLVLLDLVLPEMDGFEIIREARKDESLDKVMIVPFSNLAQEDNQAKAQEMGANDFIAKSEYTPHQLVEKVDEIMKRLDEDGYDYSKTPEGEETKKENSRKSDQKKKAKPERRSGKGSILMIEDESVFSEVFGVKLENKGFEVTTVESGEAGISEVGVNQYDLVITDIMMPDRKGSEIVNEIRHTKKNKKTPILILADETDSKEELEKAKSLGAGRVMDKNKITPEGMAEECNKAIS